MGGLVGVMVPPQPALSPVLLRTRRSLFPFSRHPPAECVLFPLCKGSPCTFVLSLCLLTTYVLSLLHLALPYL